MSTGTWILIRGLTRERAHWGPFTQTLAQAFPGADVVSVDLPGAGLLRQRRCPLLVQQMVDICRQQLQVAGRVPPYSLLGLSLGGMVAAEWARLLPEEVRCCVLTNTSMRPFSPPRQRLRFRLLPHLLRVLFDSDPLRVETAVLRLTSNQPGDHAAVLPEWLQIRRARPVRRRNALRQLLAAARYRWPGGPPAVPVLVLCSARDTLVDPDCSRRIAAAMGAPLVVHPSAGHDLPLDDGAWVVEQVAIWQQGF